MQAAEEALGLCLRKGLTFAAFRWDGQLHLWVQEHPDLAHVPLAGLNDMGECFVIAPFKDASEHILALRPTVRLTLGDAPFDPDRLEGFTGHDTLAGTTGPGWDETGHRAAVLEAQEQFSKGILRKVVLARSIGLPFSGLALPQLFTEALGAYPDAFVCLVNCPEHGTWLGASPERLVLCASRTATVDSIAGTLPAGLAPSHARDWGAKEQDEQELVSGALEAVFSDLSMDDMERSGPDVFEAGPVAHLRTTFTVPLGTTDLATLVKALHPTPAVCGTPKGQALDFILRSEPVDRGLYAGFWGPWQVDGRTELYVNIRCLHAFAEMVSIHVGGGITAGSKAQDEWKETEHKARTWTRLMHAVDLRIS